ncbi:signal peptidase complex subunit 2 [Kalaharituber pfeilii]|nr:signal peptidase complex subunit 2 [Kalaharituber pfeilii]
MAEERPKISKYSLNDLKNTTDDAIPHYLNTLGYRQIHTLTDVRLALGFSACIIAAGAFYYDYKYGFEAAKTVTLYSVVAYFVLNTALTWWMWKIESGIIYIGEKDGVKITLSSHTEKHSPYYHLTIKTTGRSVSSDREHVVEAKESFTGWFDEEGYFVPKPFQTWLDNTIPEIAAKKAVSGAREAKRQVERGVKQEK